MGLTSEIDREVYGPLYERLETARRLLLWWEATNPPDDRQTRLARDTQLWLAGGSPDVPDIDEERKKIMENWDA